MSSTDRKNKTMKQRQLPLTPPLLLLLLLLLLPLLNCATLSFATTSAATINQYLAPHNAARRSLGLPALKWDNRLAEYAQWWANQRKYDCAMVHSNGPYGENMFWGAGQGWTPGQAVLGWLSERQFYDYYSNTCSEDDCGHYTQIVWRKTTRVGCAEAVCAGGAGTIFVCDYNPPGNVDGQWPY
ncbi:hypothetical protein Ancab_017785 [Ancistrocladus abbreviatus]